jgi:MCP family monocarboxylic acid transporter-like MFS transporter 10
MVIWGFSVAWGAFLEAYLRDVNLVSQPHATSLLPLIGNLSSGIMYLTSKLDQWPPQSGPALLTGTFLSTGPLTYPLASRYPYYRRHSMWLGTVVCWLSLFVASYVKRARSHALKIINHSLILVQVSDLLLLLGVLYSIGGGKKSRPRFIAGSDGQLSYDIPSRNELHVRVVHRAER